MESHKIDIIALGCGASFAARLSQPGCSQWLNSIHLLYGKDIIDEYLMGTPDKYVSEKVSEKLVYLNKYAIGITASIPTNRKRRGPNEAFICIRKNQDIFKYHFIAKKETFFEDDMELQIRYRGLVDTMFCDFAISQFMNPLELSVAQDHYAKQYCDAYEGLKLL